MSEDRSQFEIKVPRRRTKARDDILLVSTAYRQETIIAHGEHLSESITRSNVEGNSVSRYLRVAACLAFIDATFDRSVLKAC
jgi:hypothetical protein